MAKHTTTAEPDGVDPDDPAALEEVAGRLEAALDRIVQLLDGPTPARPPAELAARLDRVIARLRDALGSAAQY